MPSAAGTTTSPSMIADRALISKASSAIFLKRLVQSLPRRVNTAHGFVGDVKLDAVAVELDLVDPALAASALSRSTSPAPAR